MNLEKNNTISLADDVLFYWKEYPDRDIEFVRWYPCVFHPMDGTNIWQKKTLVFYIHIPFCNNVCQSCLYNKMGTQNSILEDYLKALKKEIAHYASIPYIQNSEFISGYIGGGTPTSLTAKQLKELLSHVFTHLNIKDGAPVTIETTPLDIDEDKTKVMVDYNINRVSIGVQSFNEDLLKRIGRKHSRSNSKDVVKMLRENGIKEINIDLMYGLPGQTMEQWQSDLDELIALNINSVSLYYYIVLPSSPLFTKIKRGIEPPCPPINITDKLYDYAVNALLADDYVATTVNDFGNDNNDNRAWEEMGVKGYNIGPKGYKGVLASTFPRTTYLAHAWYNCGEILAFGSGAYGYIREHSYFNDPVITEYNKKIDVDKSPIIMGTYVSPEEKMRRNMVMAIKLLRVSRKDFKDRHGVDLGEVFKQQITDLEDKGLVHLTESALEVTYPKGWYYIDNISKAFYSPSNYKMPQPSLTNKNVLKYLNY